MRVELDHRWGWYAHGEWRLPSRVTFDALYYDNNGDKTAVRNVQWSWDTRFWNLGMTLDVDDHTRVLAQVLSGGTLIPLVFAGVFLLFPERRQYLRAVQEALASPARARRR